MAIADLVARSARDSEEAAGFSELVADNDWVDLGVIRARVLSRERLIEIKRRLGLPKDRAMLPLASGDVGRDQSPEVASFHFHPPLKTHPTMGFQLWRTRAEEFRTAVVALARLPESA